MLEREIYKPLVEQIAIKELDGEYLWGSLSLLTGRIMHKVQDGFRFWFRLHAF